MNPASLEVEVIEAQPQGLSLPQAELTHDVEGSEYSVRLEELEDPDAFVVGQPSRRCPGQQWSGHRRALCDVANQPVVLHLLLEGLPQDDYHRVHKALTLAVGEHRLQHLGDVGDVKINQPVVSDSWIGVQGIFVYRLARLARDLVLQEQLLAEVSRAGGQVFSTSGAEQHYLVDDSDAPSRRLIRQILGAVSEYERSMDP